MAIIVDEIIINFVRENVCLFDKTDVNFKNTIKKKDLWQKISKDLKSFYNVDMSGDTVEKRWSSLRDMFSRESRRQKLSPSGSGDYPKKEWDLYREMLFLAPHIAHRRTKTSLIQQSSNQNQLDDGNESLSVCEFSKSVGSSTPITDTYILFEDNSFDNQNIPTTVNREILCRFSSTQSNSSSDIESTRSEASDFCNLRQISSKPIKKLTPELDGFAKSRRNNDDIIAKELSEASSAISAAMSSVLTIVSNTEKEKRDGCMLAIEESLSRVPAKDKTKCLIEILQVIEKYEKV